MTPEKILENIFGSGIKQSNEYLFQCPFCNHHKKKLSINIDSNVYKCWVCEKSGKVRNLIKQVNSSYLKEWDELYNTTDFSRFVENQKEKEVIKLPEEFESLVGKFDNIQYLSALKYLYSRGIERRDIIRWKMGVCLRGKYEKRIVIPSFDQNGKLNYFVTRSYDRELWPKYINAKISGCSIIFNELYINFQKPIVIVEGVFDALKSVENTIPIMGSFLKEESYLFQKISNLSHTVYFALDKDAYKKEMKIMKKFLSYGLTIYKIDTTNCEDVGSITKEQFLERFNRAKKIDNKSILYYEMSGGAD